MLTRLVLFAAVCAVAPTCAPAAADTYAITPQGLYRASNTANGPAFEKTTAFGDDDTVINWLGTPPDDGGGNGSVKDQVSSISKELLSNTEGAAILVLVRSFSGKPSQKAGVKAAIEQLKSLGIFPNNKFDQWLVRINSLIPGDYNDTFLGEVDAGLVAAFTSSAQRATAEPAVNFLLIVKIITCVVNNLPGPDPVMTAEARHAFDLALIFKILKCVVGNLPGDLGDFGSAPEPIPDLSVPARPEVAAPLGYIGHWSNRTPNAMRRNSVLRR